MIRLGRPAQEGAAAVDRAALTAGYLREVKRRGARASELLGAVPESDLLNSIYLGRYLSRPLFIGRAEREQLYSDLENVRAALVSLPDRLYGGDIAAYARAVGANEVQVRATLRSTGRPVTRQARADLYADSSGFRRLEFNIGAAVAGMDNADICRGLLAHPVLAEFADSHGLGYVDSMHEQVNNMFAETGTERGSFPMVALAASLARYADVRTYIRHLVVRWRELGLDAHACRVEELKVTGGRVWLGGRPVDIISRLFLVEDFREPQALAVIGPVLDAAARGEVKMFTPLDSELLGNKAALAMISDQCNRHLFSAAELASFDRIVPWTVMVAPGQVTLEDGQRAELLDYAAAHQDGLVLKPVLLHSGEGVLLGWHPATSPQLWRQRLREAVSSPHVIQRRIRPVPELFPGDDGELVPWIVTWGVFTGVGGYGGVLARGATVASDMGVINVDTGASVGCCLSAFRAYGRADGLGGGRLGGG
jgi:hypothetical protein